MRNNGWVEGAIEGRATAAGRGHAHFMGGPPATPIVSTTLPGSMGQASILEPSSGAYGGDPCSRRGGEVALDLDVERCLEI
jgi:hypothetical protein